MQGFDPLTLLCQRANHWASSPLFFKKLKQSRAYIICPRHVYLKGCLSNGLNIYAPSCPPPPPYTVLRLSYRCGDVLLVLYLKILSWCEWGHSESGKICHAQLWIYTLVTIHVRRRTPCSVTCIVSAESLISRKSPRNWIFPQKDFRLLIRATLPLAQHW